MTLEQALLKIIELQQEIMELHKQLSSQTVTIPYQQSPFIYKLPDLCPNGGLHDYFYTQPGTTPPSCRKCGKQPPSFIVTSNTNEGNI